LAAVDGVPGAGHRFDVGGLAGGERPGHVVDERLGGEEVVPGESAVQIALKSENMVREAHPVFAALAKAALAAGDDLLGDDAVAQLEPVLLRRSLAESADATGVLVPGDAGAFDVAALAVRTPEEGTAEPALHVGGADPGGGDFDQEFAG